MGGTTILTTVDSNGKVTVATSGDNESIIDAFAETFHQIAEGLKMSDDDLFIMIKAIIAANKAEQSENESKLINKKRLEKQINENIC